MPVFSLARAGRGAIGGVVVLLALLARPAVGQQTQIARVPAAVQPRWLDLADSEWARGKNGRQANFDYFIAGDAQPHNAGFFGQRLRREMTALGGLVPEAEAALNRYRRQKRLFLAERLLFATTLVAAGGTYIATDYKFDTPEYILGGVAAFSLLSNVLVTRNANMHLQRAVKEYQGALFPQTPTGRTIDWRPAFGGLAPRRGGGVGLVIGWQL